MIGLGYLDLDDYDLIRWLLVVYENIFLFSMIFSKYFTIFLYISIFLILIFKLFLFSIFILFIFYIFI